MKSAIEFQNLTLAYNFIPVVQDLETTIPEGSLTAVVGPNGAGKSSLFKGIIGSLKPRSGRVVFANSSRRGFAYLPQLSEIDRTFPLSVIDLVAMGLWREIGSFGKLTEPQYARVEAAIAAVGLTGFEKRVIGSLSGGQMQRALFARLLLQDAHLVLLDEPFTAIDEKSISDLVRVIHAWHEEGRTIIAALHDQDLVKQHFPDTLMLAREMVAHGATGHVLTSENQLKAREMCEACIGSPHVCGRGVA